MSKVAIILIRGLDSLSSRVKTTLETLNMNKKHSCVIVDDSHSLRGKLRILQNTVTFGDVSDETIELLKKNARSHKSKKNVFFLAPPKGGFERKGIKSSFNSGGALGDRGSAINDLIKKMM
ncbi:MAG: uL30 family ribosomal protein [Nanobdellota archaeon]